MTASDSYYYVLGVLLMGCAILLSLWVVFG